MLSWPNIDFTAFPTWVLVFRLNSDEIVTWDIDRQWW